MGFNLAFKGLKCHLLEISVRYVHALKAYTSFVCFWARQTPPQWAGFYIAHNNTPQSVGLLRSSDQPVAETST